MSSGSAMSLLCMGDALVDMMSSQPDRSLDESEVFVRCAGGSALNTTVGAARLGVPASFCSAVGDDPFGRFLGRFLADEGVDASPLIVSSGANTGVAFASSPEGRPEFCILRGAATPAAQLRDEDVPKTALRDARLFHLCSLLVYRYAPSSFVRSCLDEAHRNGVLVSFDPNVRPHAITDPVSARDRIAECAGRAHIVKLSHEDAQWLHPEDDPEDVVRRYVGDGAILSILTRGSEGSLFAMRQSSGVVVEYVKARSVTVRDTVGAGDAYMAGLLAALIHRGVDGPRSLASLNPSDIRVACHLASCAATAACSAIGALAGLDGDFIRAWVHEMAGWTAAC